MNSIIGNRRCRPCWFLITVMALLLLFFSVDSPAQEHVTFRFGRDGDAVWDVAISLDGKSIAAVSRLGYLKVFALDKKQEEMLSIKAHEGEIPAVIFGPHGKTILTAGYDDRIIYWDAQSGTQQKTLPSVSTVYDIAISPDGTTLASSHQDGLIRLRNLNTGTVTHTLRGHNGYVGHITFSPDGTRLASSGYDSTIRVWDLREGSVLKIFRPPQEDFTVGAVRFSPNGETVLSGNFKGMVKFWDIQSGTTQHVLKAHSESVRDLAVSPNGDLLASASDDKSVKLWDLRHRTALKTLRGHTGRVLAVVFSPDGKLLVSASYDGTIRLWDVPTSTR